MNPLDVATEQGRRNQTELDGIALEAHDKVAHLLRDYRQRFLDAARAMGVGGDEARNMLREVGLGEGQ